MSVTVSEVIRKRFAAEKRILDFVNSEIAKLQEGTGLTVDEIHVHTVKISSISQPRPTMIVSDVSIDIRL